MEENLDNNSKNISDILDKVHENNYKLPQRKITKHGSVQERSQSDANEEFENNIKNLTKQYAKSEEQLQKDRMLKLKEKQCELINQLDDIYN